MRVTGIDATYYTVKDTAALTAFYSQLLGADPDVVMAGRLAEWTFDDGTSFGLYGSADATGGGNGSAMFAVADVAQAVEAARKRGVHFHDQGEVTDTPVCQMAFGQDPEGNQFIVHARKSSSSLQEKGNSPD